MALRYEKSEFLSFASCQIVATSNEDRVAAALHHKKSGAENFSSFGVFDGHQGAQTADKCQSSFHELAVGNYFHLLELSKKDKVKVDNKSISVLDNTPPSSDDNSTTNGSIPRDSSHSDESAELYISPSQEIGESSPCESSPCDASEPEFFRMEEEPTSVKTEKSAVIRPESIPDISDVDQTGELASPLDASTLLDAIFCESVRKACNTVGEDLNAISDSGTTLNSLIMRWGADGEESKGPAGTYKAPVRVYCSNVGDSRCIMLRAYDTKHALVSSSFAMHSKSPPLSAPTSPPQISETQSLDSPHESLASPTGVFSSRRSSLSLAPLGNAPSSSAKVNRFVAVHLMSEDHKLTLHRERLRIVNTTEGKIPSGSEKEYWHELPADASAIYLPQYAKTPPPLNFRGLPPIPQPADEGLDGNRSGPFGRRPKPDPLTSSSAHGYMDSPSRIDRNPDHLSHSSCHGYGLGYSTHSNMNMSLHSNNSNHDLSTNNGSNSKALGAGLNKFFIFDWGYPSRATELAAARFIEDTDEAIPEDSRAKLEKTTSGNLLSDPPLCHKVSFIRKRCNSDGTVLGPEALFSRHNSSIMMTRSIGDRYGARSCIPLPEISAFTVPEDTHARFILASDGFWDVVSVDTVRCVGLSEKYKDPRVLASQLAQKAHRRRERGGLRMDDITVMVVDVNPSSFVSVGGKNGGDGIHGKQGKDKCVMC